MPKSGESTIWSRREIMIALASCAGAALALLIGGCGKNDDASEGPCPKGGEHEWYEAASGEWRCRKCGRYRESE